ncbi:MAG: right-handed parallel beta-helix repeat-containing protein [Bdellovibrionales bacterium]|nr:right-handed parallel beta-helix repeat-containing protein [Bdellovibrionales bacterium]
MKTTQQLLLATLLSTGVTSAATLSVKPGRSIQKAIQKASPGDTIEVYPGEYRESLVIDKPNIKLVGRIENGAWPILNGEGKRNDGVIASGSGFQIEQFYIQRYKGNGVMTQGADNVVIRKLIVADTGIYGIYPTRGKHVLVEDTVSWGIADAAIYIGMCDYVDVRRNEVFKNVAGIEIENSRHALVEANLAYNNSSGILVFTLPGLPVKDGYDVVVRDNFVVANNHPNFGADGSLVANVPAGSGMVLLAADKVRIENNIIRDNQSGGLLISDLSYLAGATAPDAKVEPEFDDNEILQNLFFHNGYSPDAKVRLLLAATKFRLSSGDIVISGKGKRNCLATGLNAKAIGTQEFKRCAAKATTKDVTSFYASRPVHAAPERELGPGEKVYATVCSGCHVQGLVRIGPAIEEIQKKYKNNPDGIVAFASQPKRVRPGFSEMPSQSYLGKKKLRAVAEFILGLH